MARHAPVRDRRRMLIDGLLAACAALTLASFTAFAVDVAPDARAAVRQQPALPTAAGTPTITRAALTPGPLAVPTIGADGAWEPERTVTETATATVTAVRTATATVTVPGSTEVRTATETATVTVTSVATETATETATVTVTETAPPVGLPETAPPVGLPEVGP